MPRHPSLVNQTESSSIAKEYRQQILDKPPVNRERARYLCETQPQTAELFIDYALEALTDCTGEEMQVRGEFAWCEVYHRVRGKNVSLQYNIAEACVGVIQMIHLVEIYELCLCVAEMEVKS